MYTCTKSSTYKEDVIWPCIQDHLRLYQSRGPEEGYEKILARHKVEQNIDYHISQIP